MQYIGGIDPGLSGGLAVLDLKNYFLHVWDTPTYTQQVSGKNRKRCDAHAYGEALQTFPLDLVMLERVQSTPNDGHVGAFTFGKVTGTAIGLVIGLGYELEEVSPAKWKMQLGVPANKEAARQRASALLPKCADMWRRQMDDGRAEAALIALYAAFDHGVLPEKPFKPGFLNGKPFNLTTRRKD